MDLSSLSELCQAFHEAVGGAGQPTASSAELSEYLEAARRRSPEWNVDARGFVEHLAARSRDGQLPPVQHAGDLLLAYAWSRSIAGAAEAFEHEYGKIIDRVLSHRKATADLAADARQIVLARLLVGDASKNTGPKLADYRGSGPLHGWVATTAATTLLMLRRGASRRREQPEESGGDGLGARLDPELDYLKLRYKTEVEEAIIAALTELSDRESTLLRLHLGERMSIDSLGAMYSVNRATAARWLVAARTALVDRTKAALRTRLQLSEGECNSLVGLVQSQLDVSIVRRLNERGPE